MFSRHTFSPFSPFSPFTLATLAAAAITLAGSAQAELSNSALPLPPMHLPVQADQTWRVGSQYVGGGSFFGEGLHRNRNPDSPYNPWHDYYATDWNSLEFNNQGLPVYPVADGVVVESSCNFTSGYGCSIVIDHGMGLDTQRFRTRYAHLKADSNRLKPDNVKLFVVGDHVHHWQQIGFVSNTGTDPSMAAHLHLSTLSADRSNGLNFYSNCAMGVNAGLCDNGETHLTVQSRRINRVLNQSADNKTITTPVTDGLDLVSSNRPTLYFAGLPRNAASRTSTLKISNAWFNPANPLETNTINVTWYDRWGGATHIAPIKLAPHQSTSVNTPGTVDDYSAIVEAEPGKDIAGMATMDVSYKNAANANRVAFSGIEAISQPQATQLIPLWHQANYGWGSVIRVFNPVAENIKFDITFNAVEIPGQPSVNCSKTFDLGGHRTESINTNSVNCLPAGRYGSATIRAYYVDANNDETGPALAAASYEQHYIDAVSGEQALIAASASQESLRDVSGSNILYAPLIQNNNYNWLSGILADRLEGSGNMLIDYYYKTGGDTPCTQHSNAGVWPFVRSPLFPAGSTCVDKVLSARISSENNGPRYISAQINQTNGLNASGYPAIAAPGKRIYIPFLQNTVTNSVPQQTSGIQLQNTSTTTAAQVSITYYDNNRVASTVEVETIPANGFLTLPKTGYPFPANVLTAEISSTTPLAAAVNIVKLTAACSDCILTYVPTLLD